MLPAATSSPVGLKITKLDNWKTSILLKVKNGINDELSLT